MAAIKWRKYGQSTEYANSKVGLSEWEQAKLDSELRAKGGTTSQAGLSIEEQETIGQPMGNVTMKSGPSGGDFRTDEYMYNAAQATTQLGDKLVGGLAGFTDARSKEYLSLYGPGGPLNRMTKDQNPALRRAMEPREQQPVVSFAGDNYISVTPQYYNALKTWKGLRGAKQALRTGG